MNIRETLDRIAPESEAVDLSDLSTYALGYLDAESKYRKMIADGELVEIVRCKDCKHYKKSEVAEQYMCYRKDVEGWPVCYDFMPTDFCKYGERRTDGTD